MWPLLLAAAAFSAALAGCSGFAATNEEVPAAAPELSYRELIAVHLRKTFKSFLTYDSFEISDPRWVHSIKGWNWLACVRYRDNGHVRTYAIFFSGDKVIDDRYAVQTDNCGTQTYSPLDRMQGGLDPLH